MSARVRFEGLAELRAELRKLPADLRDQALVLVLNVGNDARDQIRAAYDAAKVTGNLSKGVSAEMEPSGNFGVRVKVKSRAKHAWIYENGTVTRKTNLGANRGAAPPGRTFIPIMIRQRKALNHALADIVRRAGLRVVGDVR